MYTNKYAGIEEVAVTPTGITTSTSIYKNQYREAAMEGGGRTSTSTLTLVTNFPMPPLIPTTMTHGPFFHPHFLRTKHEPLAMPKTHNAVTLQFTASLCIKCNV